MTKYMATISVRVRRDEDQFVMEAISATMTTVIEADEKAEAYSRRKVAEKKFRDLGLGTVMDMPGATVAIDTWRY